MKGRGESIPVGKAAALEGCNAMSGDRYDNLSEAMDSQAKILANAIMRFYEETGIKLEMCAVCWHETDSEESVAVLLKGEIPYDRQRND